MEKGDTNSYINFFMITTENAELTALVRHIEIFIISNTDLLFGSPQHGLQKNEKEKNMDYCKALCVSLKHNSAETWLLIFTKVLPTNLLLKSYADYTSVIY